MIRVAGQAVVSLDKAGYWFQMGMDTDRGAVIVLVLSPHAEPTDRELKQAAQETVEKFLGQLRSEQE